MKIDVWSDVICPFCYIGKRRLELALERTGIAADVEFHSFELSPDAPRSYGAALPDVMGMMYGASRPQALQVLAHEEAEAASVGLDFQWRTAQPGNTFDAHRLVHLAKSHGLGTAAEERFFRAYFSESEPVGSPEVLRRLALEIGLGADEIDEVLSGDRFADDVRADEQRAMDLGVRGVPFFVIDNDATISGAQSVEAFVAVLQSQASKAISAGAVCHDGYCELPR